MSTPAIRISKLHYSYPDGTPALDEVDLEICEGERWALAGSNGSGKSTLLHHVAGVHPGDEHVEIFGKNATRANLGWVRSQVGFVFQNPEDQLFMPTLREDVAFGPINQGRSEDEVTRCVDDALSRVGLLAMGDRPPHHLSGGEKRAAALATVLALQPRALVLDEPTNDLDPAGRREFIRFLTGWEGTLLLATHDLELILEVATHLAVVHRGRIALTGDPLSLLADAKRLPEYHLEVPPSLRANSANRPPSSSSSGLDRGARS